MADIKQLINSIREHETQQAIARKTNERTLPLAQGLLSNLDTFNFGNEDADLKMRLATVGEKLNEFTVDTITAEDLEFCRNESAKVLHELEVRYQKRLEVYASRQNNI